jgi:hypothetical protein
MGQQLPKLFQSLLGNGIQNGRGVLNLVDRAAQSSKVYLVVVSLSDSFDPVVDQMD